MSGLSMSGCHDHKILASVVHFVLAVVYEVDQCMYLYIYIYVCIYMCVCVLQVNHEAKVTKNQALCNAFDELSTCYFKVKNSAQPWEFEP